MNEEQRLLEGSFHLKSYNPEVNKERKKKESQKTDRDGETGGGFGPAIQVVTGRIGNLWKGSHLPGREGQCPLLHIGGGDGGSKCSSCPYREISRRRLLKTRRD